MHFAGLILLVGFASANAVDLKAGSPQGKKLLDKARKLSDAGSNYQMYMEAYNSPYGQNGQYGQYGQYYGQYGQQEYQQEYQQNWDAEGEVEDEYEEDNQVYQRNWGNSESGSFDTTWLTGYSIKFDGCVSDKASSDAQNDGATELLAKFKLCPDSSGKKCRHSGEYITRMADYIEAFEGIVMSDEKCQLQQETCAEECIEKARYYQASDANDDGARRRLNYNYGYSNYQNSGYNNQNNQNNNQNNQNNQYNQNYQNYQNEEDEDQDNYFDETSCRYDCMTTAGMGYCEQNARANGANGYNNLDIPRMVDCHQVRYYSAYSNPLYVGATCRNGGVYLDTFYDSSCTQTAPKGTHEQALGYSLPDQNLVSNDLVSCNSYKNNNYASYQNFEDYNQYQEYAQEQAQNTIGVCADLYQNAGKCETHMKKDKQNNGGCDYIRKMSSGSSWSKALKVLAGLVLALAIPAIGCYYFYVIRKRRGGKSFLPTGKPPVPSFVHAVSTKSLNEPLDSGSVTSGSTTCGETENSTPYEGAKMDVDEPKNETEQQPDAKTGDV